MTLTDSEFLRLRELFTALNDIDRFGSIARRGERKSRLDALDSRAREQIQKVIDDYCLANFDKIRRRQSREVSGTLPRRSRRVRTD